MIELTHGRIANRRRRRPRSGSSGGRSCNAVRMNTHELGGRTWECIQAIAIVIDHLQSSDQKSQCKQHFREKHDGK